MIYDLVTTILIPGKAAEWGDIASKDWAAIRKKAGIKQVGSFHAYTGDMNTMYTIRVFNDLAEVQKIREFGQKDKDFQSVNARMVALTQSQSIVLLEPNPWLPMR